MLNNFNIVKYQKDLHNFAYNLTQDKTNADDLVQETFLKALLKKDTFTEGTNLKAWLFTICKNTFINKYRFQDKNKSCELFENIKSCNNAANGIMDYEDTMVYLSRNAKYPIARAIDLRAKGYSYEEIAKMEEIPMGTVKSRIFIGRQILNKLN